MLIIRPIEKNDLSGLMSMLKYAGYGLTSLPRDPEVLTRRIESSIASFAKENIRKPAGEDYLFVMEHLFSGDIAGVCSIVSKIGGFDPFYFYREEKHETHSDQLKRTNNFSTLHIEKIHAGPSEICSLFLDPKYRNSQKWYYQKNKKLHTAYFLLIATQNQKPYRCLLKQKTKNP